MSPLAILGATLLWGALVFIVIAFVAGATRPEAPRPDLNDEWAALDPDQYVNGAS